MAIETILGFRNVDSTENLNARLAGLVPKGIVKGGIVIPEPASLQVRVKGNPLDGVVFLAFGNDGMMVRERAEERVLPVVAGLTNVVALRCKYLESQPPLVSLEVMTLGAYNNDPDKASLIRFASVTPPANATAVLPEHINSSFRDSVEGFKRGVVRGVVDTKVDLPATSGFPATAEINFTSNTFAEGSSISISTGATALTFPLVTPISFEIADPSEPGLSRVNPSQKTILSAVQDSVGLVTVTTAEPHGFARQTIRISDNSAAQANSLWTIEDFTENTFSFQAPLNTPWSGVGGSVVDTFTPATVTATVAPGSTHTFIPGQQFIITGATEQTFNGLFTVQTVVNAQKILFQQIGYPSRDSGNGRLNKVGYSLPPNAVEIGESGDITAKNFEQTLRASELDGDLKIFAMGSSLQIEARVSGSFGNTFTITKDEPGATVSSIVLSNFSGGIDPNAAAAQATAESLQKGDLYVVLFGELGTIELWGYDGTIFRNLTSASAATLLDFHRRNLFINEKHLAENEKAALVGTVGIPGANNRYVTEQDVSVLTETTAAALQGADSVPPGQTNRYLTEARIRGQRGSIVVPEGQNYVELPLGETWVVGNPPQLTFESGNVDITTSTFLATNHGFLNNTKVIFTTTSSLPGGIDPNVFYYIVNVTTDSFKVAATSGGAAITLSSSGSGTIYVCDDTYAKKFFNLIHTETLHTSGGCTEYSQEDFTPVVVSGVYVDSTLTTVLNPYDHCALNGTFPRPDAIVLSKPLQLYVKLSATPNNGSATVLYSQSVIERNRMPQADMIMGPQRIIPAELQDVINKTKELRFHAGIAASGTTVTFPPSLFRSENLQGFKYRRFVGNRPVDLISGFSINFATGTGTTNIVTSFTPVSYTGQAGMWTRYALFLTSTDKIQVSHVASLLETTSDQSFASSLDSVAVPSMAMTDGSYMFATVGVKVNSTATGIESIKPEQLEFYTYHNSRDPGAVIVCGDGTSSYGHFTGSTSHIRAFSYASVGDTILLRPGTYSGNLIVNKDDITLDCSAGAILQNTSSTVLTVVADRFQAIAPRFRNCAVAVDIQPGSENFKLDKPSFETGVTTRLKTPPRITFTSASFSNSIITFNEHGLLAGAKVKLTSTGALPSGLSTTPTYYIASVTANTFRLATNKSGSSLVSFTNATGSGTHTVHAGQLVEPQLDDTAIAKWVVTDGSSLYWAGDFNGPSGIQQAHDAASEGDVILVYPGTYNPVTWSKSNLVLKGFGGSKIKVNAGGSTFTALTVSGSYNQFDNFIIENAGTGIVCLSGAVHNSFGTNVQFGDNVRTTIKFPVTAATKHYNYHPSLCGRVTTGNSFQADNPVVTVGDGVVSWGDYVGENAINVALQEENEGTTIQVFRGTYLALECTSNGKSVVGAPGHQTIIRADALLNKVCLKVQGNKNFFKNLFVQADNNDAEAIGLTTVGVEVNGSDNHFENINFPETGSERIESHLKYKVVSGFRNRFLPHTGAPSGEISWTVGDGVRSFGDFNGSQGISAAILALPSHPRSLKGVYDGAGGLTEVQTWPGKISGALGALAKFSAPKSVNFTASDITQGSAGTGSTFNSTAHGFTVNEPVTFISTGFLPAPLVASPLGATDSVTYYVVNVTANTFQVSPAANGTPLYLSSLGTETHTMISGLPFNFSADDLYRNINISSATNADNIGSFLITEVLDRSSVMLTRLDGKVFSDETNITYDFVSGAKITVMPGVYDPFVIPASKNDVEITAWGSGSDVIIKGFDGATPVSPILRIDGSRCFVQGFRFSGGVPTTGVAIHVNGSYNTFIGNRFETANRYSFDERAIGNRVFDSAEAEGRTAFTVSAVPSRADYTGTNEAPIQAALDAISRDNHLATVYLGKGTWTFRQTVNVPPNVQILGTGYETRFVGDGTFPAFQLHPDGGQSFVGVHIENFTYSLAGPAEMVYVVASWQTDAVVDPTVKGEIRFFGETKLYGDVTIDGSLTVSDYVMVGPGGVLDTTGSIGTLYDSPSTIYLGTLASDDSLYDFATGSTASGSTKTVNIGTNGLLGSTTNIKVGSTNGGTTTLQNYTVVDDRLKVNNAIAIGTSPTSAAVTANGKLLVGNAITSASLSNTVNFTSSTGLNAFRAVNLVDSSATMKIVRTDSSNGPALELQQWNPTISSLTAYWDIYTEAGRFGFRDRTSSSRNRLFIDEFGRVLIGSSTGTAAASVAEINPSYTLNVRGSAIITSPSSGHALQVSNSSGSPFVITGDTAVGIGTDAPIVKLDVSGAMRVTNIYTGYGLNTEDAAVEVGKFRSGDGHAYLDLIATASSSGDVDYSGRLIRHAGSDGDLLLTNTGSGNIQFIQQGDGTIRWSTNSSERMRIDNVGYVGIGTQSPTSRLTLSGESSQFPTSLLISPTSHSVSKRAALTLDNWSVLQDRVGNGTKDFSILDSTASMTRLLITADGSVGINTTSPGSNLEVGGRVVADFIKEIDGYCDYASSCTVTISGGVLNEGGPHNRGVDSYWQATATGQSITLDLGSVDSSLVGICFGTYYRSDVRYIPRAYAIDYSSNNTTWTNLTTQTGNTNASVSHFSSTSFSARYIRITVNTFQNGITQSMISGVQILSRVGGSLGSFDSLVTPRAQTFKGDKTFIGSVVEQKPDGAKIYLAQGVNIEDVVETEATLDMDFSSESGIPGALSFTRASTGRYYDGKTSAKAEENILRFSEDFENPVWEKSTAFTVSANQTAAPNGTTTADTITSTSATAALKSIQNRFAPDGSGVSGTFTFSFYAKRGTHNFIQALYYGVGGGSAYANFDLLNGTVGSTSVGSTATITSVGSTGWYRCVHTSALSINTHAAIAFVNSSTSARAEVSTAVGTVSLWGAQLEERDFATDYTPTTTDPVRNYVPVLMEASVNTPRIDHDPLTGETKGLYIEEARNNLLTYSEDFSNAAWVKTNSSPISNCTVGLDGLASAEKLVENTTNSIHRFEQFVSIPDNTNYAFSVYVKAGERSFCYLEARAKNNTFPGAFFNLSTGTVGSVFSGAEASITPVGNGWYRCSILFSTLTGSTPVYVGIQSAVGSSILADRTYQGDGYSGVFVWGAQLEAGMFATSYIKTSASSSSRAIDGLRMSGPAFSEWYRQGEGTFFVQASNVNHVVSEPRRFIEASDGTAGSSIVLGRGSLTQTTAMLENFSTIYANHQVSLGAYKEAQVKMAFAYKFNSSRMATNGILSTLDTSGIIPTLDQIDFGQATPVEGSADKVLNGHLRRVIYWPLRLDDDTLQTITAV